MLFHQGVCWRQEWRLGSSLQNMLPASVDGETSTAHYTSQLVCGLYGGISRQNGCNSTTRPPIEFLRPLFTLQLLRHSDDVTPTDFKVIVTSEGHTLLVAFSCPFASLFSHCTNQI